MLIIPPELKAKLTKSRILLFFTKMGFLLSFIKKDKLIR
ncbi:hypothetical protein Pmu_05920 [Pasteurella multocida 36950]|nr:hypothetical protein Pmu_05920 [Pasteurella multocida 36950]